MSKPNKAISLDLQVGGIYHPNNKIAAAAVDGVKASARRKKRKWRPAKPDVTLYFETGRLGSGWRGLVIRSVGHKWVRVARASDGKPAKLKRAVWDDLMASQRNQPA